MTSTYDLSSLSDVQLMSALFSVVAGHRQTTAALLAHLAEVDRRRLSEGSAYKSIAAARAARAFPVIFEMLARGELHTSGVVLLAPRLTADNWADLLAAAVHQSKRQLELLLAARFPSSDVATVVRKLPEPKPTAQPLIARPESEASGVVTPSLAPLPTPKPAVVAPLAPERFKVQFTASATLVDKLRRAQDLLRHRSPDADLAEVCERAVDALLLRLEREAVSARRRSRARREPRGHARAACRTR
jgi:hypothetical protein